MIVRGWFTISAAGLCHHSMPVVGGGVSFANKKGVKQAINAPRAIHAKRRRKNNWEGCIKNYYKALARADKALSQRCSDPKNKTKFLASLYFEWGE